jgi:hypothetical protein
MDATNQTAQIRAALESKPYPITAQYIAELSGLDKKIVNRLLSMNENATTFEKLACSPPLWRIRPTS